MDNIKKIKRTAQLTSVLSKYGFDTLVTKTGLKKFIPENFIKSPQRRKEIFSLSVYERIRMVLEELGPAYIKLGQLLSNRDDLLPLELTHELKKLQDDVNIKQIDIYETLREELLIEPEDVFEYIAPYPIASASLSQVYAAVLKEDKQDVVIKVKKKGTLEIIEADILIMKDFANILEKYYDAARQLGLRYIVNVFEKSILSELSFDYELNNIEKFRSNFKGNDSIYIPATYINYSNRNILCMEYIDGIKISDKEKILEYGLDTKKIASTVVDLYLKQVIDYGFFHADPHSGNIFVMKNGQVAFIDYGSVGKMLPKDKEYLGDLILNIIRKDIKRVIRIIKKIAVKYNINNELQLERDLYDFIEMMEDSSVKDLDMNEMSSKFNRLLHQNKTILPDYIYLLVRGIVLLEGIGRELGLQTSIIEYIKPYGTKLLRKRLEPKFISKKIFDKVYDISDRLEEMPEDIHSLIQKINNGDLEISHTLKGLPDMLTTINRLVVAILVASLGIGSSILILAGVPPKLWDISVLGMAGLVFAGICAVVVILSILKR